MMRTSNTQPTALILLSVRIYRVLFMLYPAEYREEYAPHMAQLFRDMCRDAYLQDGSLGMVSWWAASLFDLLITAFEERRKAEVRFNMALLKRFAGIFLIGGGISFMLASYSQLQPGSHYTFTGVYSLSSQFFFPALLLIMLGVMGLAVRYGSQLGRAGSLALWVGAIGLLGGCIWIGSMLIPNASDGVYILFITGFMLYNICMIIFGVIAMRRNVLPRWNVLPIVIGVMTVAMLFFSRSAEHYGAEWPTFFWILLTGLFHAMIGYGIQQERTSATVSATA